MQKYVKNMVKRSYSLPRVELLQPVNLPNQMPIYQHITYCTYIACILSRNIVSHDALRPMKMEYLIRRSKFHQRPKTRIDDNAIRPVIYS